MHKNILITGAGRGLGYELAHFFWEKGSNLFLVVRSSENLDSHFESHPKRPGQVCRSFVCDLACEDQRAALIHHLEPFGLDVLINNAAIQGPIGPFWENTWESWKNTLSVTLLAPVFLCQALLPHFIKHGNKGVILNLSGGGATSPRPYFSAYATAKAGLVRFSETLAHELKGSNIRVNCIAPGPLPTGMLKEVMECGEPKLDPKEWEMAQATFNTHGDCFQHVARLCEFLISDNAQHISGRLISALWDPWEDYQHFSAILSDPNFYTLRRVVPHDSSSF
jgi:3-oxoacyl-[acyl-carrier protein] reductase